MAVIKLFAAVREAAGLSQDEIKASTLAELLEIAASRYGSGFQSSMKYCKVAVNGRIVDPTEEESTPLEDRDEVALLPPVSGGSRQDVG